LCSQAWLGSWWHVHTGKPPASDSRARPDRHRQCTSLGPLGAGAATSPLLLKQASPPPSPPQVIGYIASHFRKDKIWMRRTRPDKRKYQVGGVCACVCGGGGGEGDRRAVGSSCCHGVVQVDVGGSGRVCAKGACGGGGGWGGQWSGPVRSVAAAGGCVPAVTPHREVLQPGAPLRAPASPPSQPPCDAPSSSRCCLFAPCCRWWWRWTTRAPWRRPAAAPLRWRPSPSSAALWPASRCVYPAPPPPPFAAAAPRVPQTWPPSAAPRAARPPALHPTVPALPALPARLLVPQVGELGVVSFGGSGGAQPLHPLERPFTDADGVRIMSQVCACV
jgi:hypothetical protein